MSVFIVCPRLNVGYNPVVRAADSREEFARILKASPSRSLPRKVAYPPLDIPGNRGPVGAVNEGDKPPTVANANILELRLGKFGSE